MTNDLDDLFAPPPADAGQTMQYRQGTIMSFDSGTLANTVQAGGTLLTNLPLLGVAEAATLAPGAVVGLVLLGGPSKTWAILGRLVTPGSQQALDAVTQLSQRIVSNSVANADTCSSATFGDLANYGPEVTALIGVSGRALVIVSAQVTVGINSGTATEADISYAMSGAYNYSADQVTAAGAEGAMSATLTTTGSLGPTITHLSVMQGLTPGLITFTTKYRLVSGPNATFARRNITVFAL